MASVAALFSLGAVVATPAALAVLDLAGVEHSELLARHQSGDWGDLGTERALNDEAVREGLRAFSAYDLAGVPTRRVYIITEHDRSAAIILLPSEY